MGRLFGTILDWRRGKMNIRERREQQMGHRGSLIDAGQLRVVGDHLFAL